MPTSDAAATLTAIEEALNQVPLKPVSVDERGNMQIGVVTRWIVPAEAMILIRNGGGLNALVKLAEQNQHAVHENSDGSVDLVLDLAN